MVDQFNKVQNTGNSVPDIAALKSHILSKASLYDGKDKHALIPKTRLELKAGQHVLEDDDEAFYDVEQYSTYQHEHANYETATYTTFRTNTSNTPGGRIPDHVWRIMTDENKKAWASMPHNIRSHIIAINNPNPYGSGRPPDSRSSGRFGSGRNPGRGGGCFGRGRGSERSRPQERRAYSHASNWLYLPDDDERNVNWTKQSYYPSEDN